uniref:C-type lectin domain-containing protein n=1 Tax=Pygocentrus nattereri TaxID=42514 RepID=A0AAR2IS67_PYGNA
TMNTLVLLCLFCISFSHGAPAAVNITLCLNEHAYTHSYHCPFLLAEFEPVVGDAAEVADIGNEKSLCPSKFSDNLRQQGSLASVQSPAEYQFLQSLADLGGQTSAWIGAFNFQSTWMWIDRAGFYYSNWQSLSSVSSNPCAYLQTQAGWANTNCATTLAFFCVRIPQC